MKREGGAEKEKYIYIYIEGETKSACERKGKGVRGGYRISGLTGRSM